MEKQSPPDYEPPSVDPPSGYVSPPDTTNAYPTTSLIVSPTTPVPVFGPRPQTVICPSCQQQVITRVMAESSIKTHVIAALLCLVSCCCIPYLIDSCKNRNHYCPSCNAYLGAYTN